MHYTLENPGIFMTQTLENSEEYPGEPLKTLEFKLELKIWLTNLIQHNLLGVYILDPPWTDGEKWMAKIDSKWQKIGFLNFSINFVINFFGVSC